MTIEDGKIINALVLHDGNRSHAADAAGCSRRTIQQRMKDPAFLEKLLVAQADREQRLCGAVDGAVTAAFAYLTRVITHENAEFDPITYDPDEHFDKEDRLAACRVVLDHAGLLNQSATAALAVMANVNDPAAMEAA